MDSCQLFTSAIRRRYQLGWTQLTTLYQKRSQWSQADAQYLDQLHILQRWYAFRSERTEILRFLEKYPFLVPLLVEAYYNIVTYVPHSLVYLDVITDPEEFGAEQLIAFIATDLDPDEATNALSYFDKKWWLNSLQRAQGKLCITLEFQ